MEYFVQQVKYFHEYALKNAKQYPCYFYRYEDLINDQESEITKIYEYFLAQESLEGTYCEQRIKKLIG